MHILVPDDNPKKEAVHLWKFEAFTVPHSCNTVYSSCCVSAGCGNWGSSQNLEPQTYMVYQNFPHSLGAMGYRPLFGPAHWISKHILHIFIHLFFHKTDSLMSFYSFFTGTSWRWPTLMQDEQFAWLGRFSPMILQDARPPTRKMSASSLEAAGPLGHGCHGASSGDDFANRLANVKENVNGKAEMYMDTCIIHKRIYFP